MSRVIPLIVLFAQDSRLDHLTSRFRGQRARLDSGDVMLGFAGLALLVLLIWLLSVALSWQEKRRETPSPLGLFIELCRAHKLAWADRWLLWRLAKSQHLRDPARVFLEADRFDHVHLTGALRNSKQRLEELRNRLFSNDPDQYPASGRDPTWGLPVEERVSTPLSPITPTPRLDV